MRLEEEEWYIGMELGNQCTMVSFYGAGRKEPETKGLVTGSESYQIPTAIGRKSDGSPWCLTEKPEGIYIDHLLEKAVREEVIEIEAEETYPAKELFFLFLRKVIRMVLPASGIGAVTRVVFSVEQVTPQITDLLLQAAAALGLKSEQMLIQDNKESFYAYAVSQAPELWMYEVGLFFCENRSITYWELNHDKRTMPQVSRVIEEKLGELPEDSEERDYAFYKVIQQMLNGKIVSCVYLIGDGFEEGWMKQSLQAVCQGRRAFQGKNLYTKGACYAGVLDAHPKQRETIYFCDYKTKKNIFLKRTEKGQEKMYPLVEAGKNRYQIEENCRILLEGEPVLDIWVQSPGKKEAVIENLELSGLKPAPEKGCRLELQVKGSVTEGLQLVVRDVGLGELLPGTGQEWEYEIG